MSTIAIYTNTDERCGNAEYARDLAAQLRKHYVVSVGHAEPEADVVIVNWHPAVVPINVATVQAMQAAGRKVILIHQNSTETAPAAEGDILHVVDAVVAHEPVASQAKIHYIPHGVPVVGGLATKVHLRIGTAGFPFSWKRMDVAAEAAKRTGCQFLAIAPTYARYNSTAEIGKILMKQIPRTIIHEEFLPTADVVRGLSSCVVNIFWFQSESIHDQFGQTGSARLGVAAKRPIIISRHRKFRTMIEEFEDELYIADTEEEVYEMAGDIIEMEALGAAVKPTRQWEETNWDVAGEKYHALIEGLLHESKRDSATVVRL